MDKPELPTDNIKINLEGHGECEFKHITEDFVLLVEPVSGVFPIARYSGSMLIVSVFSQGAVFDTGVITPQNIEEHWCHHNKLNAQNLKGSNDVRH